MGLTVKKIIIGFALAFMALVASAQPTGYVYGIAWTGPTANQLRFITTGPNISVYNDIFDAIPGDWAQTIGNPGYIANKPTVFPPDYHTQPWSTITSTPTTRAGYGITDALGTSDLTPYLTSATAASTYATGANMMIALAAKQNTLTLTTTGTGAATLTGGALNIPTPAAAGTTAITGTTAKTGSYRVYQSGTITTVGTMVFQLTTDGLSTGTALFPNETFTDSVQPIVSDATASYQFAWAFSNGNKTLTVTVNKLTTANILTGVLGQSGAPAGTIVKLTVEGR